MRYLILIILVFALGLTLVKPVFALTVSPPRLEMYGDPGGTFYGKFDLINELDTVKTYYSSFENFEARGEGGSPYFLTGDDGLAGWLATDGQITLQPGEKKTIQFSIQIPADAEPGGHFAAVFWGTNPPNVGAGGLAIGGKLGILILLSISGEIEGGEGGLLEFKTEGGRIQSTLPITFFYRYSNDGGNRVKPVGEIVIKNTFGGTAAIIDSNKVEGNVLPGSVRKYSVPWHTKGQRVEDLTKLEEIDMRRLIEEESREKQGFFEIAGQQWQSLTIGIYKAELNNVYGDEVEPIKATWRFVIIPWQLLSIIAVILGIFGFIGSRGLKRYNRWLIKQVQAGRQP